MITTSAICTHIEYSMSWEVAITHFQVAQKIPFCAGQFFLGTFEIAGKIIKRSYSVYSAPLSMESDSHFALLVKKVQDPYVSKYLTQDIKVWDQITLTGPLWHLTLPANAQKILFLSIGSGVTPIACMMQDLIYTDQYTQIINIYGERYRDHIAPHTRDLFQTQTDRIQSDIYLSQEPSWVGYHVGHIQEGLTHIISQLDHSWTIVICGKPTFVDEMIQILISHGVTKEQIKSEKY